MLELLNRICWKYSAGQAPHMGSEIELTLQAKDLMSELGRRENNVAKLWEGWGRAWGMIG